MRGVMIQNMSNFKIQEEKNIESANFFLLLFYIVQREDAHRYRHRKVGIEDGREAP